MKVKEEKTIIKCGQSGFKFELRLDGEYTITSEFNPNIRFTGSGQDLFETFMDFQSFYITYMENVVGFEYKSGLVQPH
jgi:hypothetical protein